MPGSIWRRQGVRQFIDVGTGIPASSPLHTVVQAVTPGARVVYADNDPIVLVWADELEDGTPEGTARCIEADVRQPDELLAAVERTGCIDFGQPVALILHALLDFVPDAMNPYELVGRLVQRMSPDSYLSLSHSTGDFAPKHWKAVAAAYRQHGIATQPHTKAEVLRFFHGLELTGPGLEVAHRWRPDPARGPSLPTDRQVSVYAGVARKPAAP